MRGFNRPRVLGAFSAVCVSAAEIADSTVSGSWLVTDTITSVSGQCGESLGDTSTLLVVFQVNGNILTAINAIGEAHTLLLNGNVMSWTDTEVVGTEIYTETGSGTFTGNTFAATASFSYSNTATGVACSGTSTVTGVKISPASIDSEVNTVSDAPNMYIVYDDGTVEFGWYQEAHVEPGGQAVGATSAHGRRKRGFPFTK